MNPALHRLGSLIVFLLLGAVSAYAADSPVFLTGTGGAYPDYTQEAFSSVPVGKTVVIPVAVQGSGPMQYSVTSSTPALAPLLKTGYPVMSVNVSYSGTTGSLTTLYSFAGGKGGGSPYAGVTQGEDGNLYGVTETDGSSGYGTVYQITTSGSFTTLHSFSGKDGANPYAPLIQGTGGTLYGTTETSGSNGYGTAFAITTSGSLSTLHSFSDGDDGGHPYGALVQGSGGQLYGTTMDGGANGHGIIFEITSSGSFYTLHAFTGGADGGTPDAGLVLGGTDELLYGTTTAGGKSSAGTMFQFAVTTGSFTTLHSFVAGTEGAKPGGALVQGTGGNFYGTTETDGTGGYGTVYNLNTDGAFFVMHSFAGGANGSNPQGGLVQASDGNFYGTTEKDGTSGYGTVFEITPSGAFATLHAFKGGSDGANPYGGMIQGTDGTLYGTTEADGADNHGTIFQLPVPHSGAFSGTMKFALLRDMAPTTTSYIAGFAESGYYNGLDFFRITDLDGNGTFIAQAGAKTNSSTGTPGFAYNNEFSPSLIFTGQGQLAMANSGFGVGSSGVSTFLGTNGSQFFITQNPLRALDFAYTVFGQLIAGFDIMNDVMSVPLQSDGSSPVQKVVINSATVSEDNTDAVLLVSAAGPRPNGGTITVTATDPKGNKAVHGSAKDLALTIYPYNDSVNDPPIIEPVANMTAALNHGVTFPIRSQDLEYDYLVPSASFLNYSPDSLVLNGETATLTPSSAAPVGGVSIGLEVYQPYTSVLRSDIYDETALTVGFGSGKLISLPALFSGTTSGNLASSTGGFAGSTTIFASFTTSNPQAVPKQYTPLINWGDGAILAGSNGVTVVHSASSPTGYDVTYSKGHQYKHPGIYPVNVTVTDTNGGSIQVLNTAVVSGGPIYAFGRTFTAPGGTANALVATFVDHSPDVVAADYAALINWGDGTVNNGTITGANGSFSVYGQHKYTAGTTYPVDVTVVSRIESGQSSYAWSTVQLSGLPVRQPPFAQSHVNGQIGDPGYNGLYVDEEVTLFNSGNLPSGPIELKFYLSPDSATQPINSAAIPLSVGGHSTYNTPSIDPGSAIEGAVSEITLPSNVNSRGRYIIMQIITSDPVANSMYYPHAASDPFPLIE